MSLPSELLPVGLLGTGEAAAESIDIERSVRFNSSDTAYLSRTPASAGNRKTWTWAGWVKKVKVSPSDESCLFGDTNEAYDYFRFTAADAFGIGWRTGSNQRKITSTVYRDASAWYHIVVKSDTTQASEPDRVKLYINGIEQTAFATNNAIAQDYEWRFNNNTAISIGRRGTFGTAADYLDGYLADIHFIDGQALGPTSFGGFDANGIWQPIEYTGTYGTNGFHLDFSDNSSAAALGYDAAGSNDWTVNNLSVTAGAGNDSLVDVPTNGTETDTGIGGEVRGNYCTWNPVASTPNILSNGNLETTFTNTSSAPFPRDTAVGSIAVSSGKWYWEVNISGTNVSKVRVGIFVNSIDYSNVPLGFRKDTGNLNNTSATLGLALDVGAGTLKLYENNTLTYTENFTANSLCIPAIAFAYNFSGSAASICNFGQRPFAYTAPSGHKALCTANLPSTTIITSGSFTGNSSTDGPFIYLNGVPTAMTINSNSVTFGTHADKLSNGFKVRSSSSSYNQSGSNTYSITSTGDAFKNARAQTNP